MACPLVDIANHGSELNGDAMVWSGMGLVKQCIDDTNFLLEMSITQVGNGLRKKCDVFENG